MLYHHRLASRSVFFLLWLLLPNTTFRSCLGRASLQVQRLSCGPMPIGTKPCNNDGLHGKSLPTKVQSRWQLSETTRMLYVTQHSINKTAGNFLNMTGQNCNRERCPAPCNCCWPLYLENLQTRASWARHRSWQFEICRLGCNEKHHHHQWSY